MAKRPPLLLEVEGQLYAPFPRPVPIPSTAFDAGEQYTLSMNGEWLARALGALEALVQPDAWQGDPAAQQAAVDEATRLLIPTQATGGGMAIGVVFPYVTTDPPAGAVKCDGTVYADTDYPALWAIINPAWKVDATHWRAPDTRNRFPAGAGGSDAPGAQGGSETIQIAHNQLPAGVGFLDSAPSGGTLSGTRYLVSSPANVTARYFLSGYGQPVTVLPPYEAYDWAVQVE